MKPWVEMRRKATLGEINDRPVRDYFGNPIDRSGFVYLAGPVELEAVKTTALRVKIGRTANPPKRLESLRRDSPVPVEFKCLFFVRDCCRLETILHRRYSSHRLHGEWFDLPFDEVWDLYDELGDLVPSSFHEAVEA